MAANLDLTEVLTNDLWLEIVKDLNIIEKETIFSANSYLQQIVLETSTKPIEITVTLLNNLISRYEDLINKYPKGSLEAIKWDNMRDALLNFRYHALRPLKIKTIFNDTTIESSEEIVHADGNIYWSYNISTNKKQVIKEAEERMLESIAYELREIGFNGDQYKFEVSVLTKDHFKDYRGFPYLAVEGGSINQLLNTLDIPTYGPFLIEVPLFIIRGDPDKHDKFYDNTIRIADYIYGVWIVRTDFPEKFKFIDDQGKDYNPFAPDQAYTHVLEATTGRPMSGMPESESYMNDVSIYMADKLTDLDYQIDDEGRGFNEAKIKVKIPVVVFNEPYIEMIS